VHQPKMAYNAQDNAELTHEALRCGPKSHEPKFAR
jgi:hypothetical protein